MLSVLFPYCSVSTTHSTGRACPLSRSMAKSICDVALYQPNCRFIANTMEKWDEHVEGLLHNNHRT